MLFSGLGNNEVFREFQYFALVICGGGKSERERRAGERENDVESWAVSRLGQISHNHSDSQLDRRGQAVVVVFVYVCIMKRLT